MDHGKGELKKKPFNGVRIAITFTSTALKDDILKGVFSEKLIDKSYLKRHEIIDCLYNGNDWIVYPSLFIILNILRYIISKLL